MSKVVNLRLARKRKSREERALAADNNRQRFGISTKDKKLAKKQSEIRAQELDGKQRQKPA